jgi:hypothetical protein
MDFQFTVENWQHYVALQVSGRFCKHQQEMWIYVGILVALLYAIYKEREALGCDTFSFIKACNNHKSNVMRGNVGEEGDSDGELLNKIEDTSDYTRRFVRWRKNFILSTMSVVMLWFVLFKKLPSEYEMVVGILVLFVMISASDSFYDYHIVKPNADNVKYSVRLLRK